MTNYDQRYQSVANQWNIVINGTVSISEYIPVGLLQLNQFDKDILLIIDDMNKISEQISFLHHQERDYLQSDRFRSQEEWLIELRTILDSASFIFQRMAFKISDLRDEYKSWTASIEVSISHFLKANHTKIRFDQGELYQLLEQTKNSELSILEMSYAINQMVIILKSMLSPKEVSEHFSYAKATCIERIEAFLQLVDQSIHVTWRIRGIIEGFLRLTCEKASI
ncbi:MAG: hypothetical protein GFH27_549289n196 [Chloroflexi bacterium AL-W]|nr:hypothetical protein [Chloroflexi bacterium AL-N1]NOK66929.1 hypothetical protein [Chloroflexi bacterium AL-N10]NOK74779.1 hypothetical protein [Chloroflexi bacterium AL-N5]NOK81531.1 hypothetical protein [Chloroflexi bacterium AL-W]NOK89001.1 hypothetical protein [Chloroflexi bacterium AL-N15]